MTAQIQDVDSEKNAIRLLDAFLSDKRNWEGFSPGRNSLSGNVSLGGREVFVKICTNEHRLVRLENEYQWLKRIVSVGASLVPEPYALTKLHALGIVGAVAQERVAGDSLSVMLERNPSDRDALLSSFGGLLRRFHALPLTSQTITFDGESWTSWRERVLGSASNYFSDISKWGGKLPSGLEIKVLDLFNALESILPNETMGPIHGDPTLTNVIVDSDNRWVLVDLELAHYGDPMMDIALARLFCFDPESDDFDLFRDGYGRSLTEQELLRVDLYRILRVIRLMRGKLWIYRDYDAFEKHIEQLIRLVELLKCRLSVVGPVFL
jgi:aminoglycoside phosphotransferase (APT) family kinase protein